MDSSHQRLGVELEALALEAAADEYDQLNFQLFGRRLRRPPLAWTDGSSVLGTWRRDPPGITLSLDLLTRYEWVTLIEVLKHEMAHQYVTDVMGVNDETAHGPAFVRVCAERCIDARASGAPSVSSTESQHAVDKIRKLLALAESANQNEAEAAMAAAQRLMLKYNVEEVARNRNREFVVAHLGQPTGRVQESQRVLAAILHEFFFVEVLWLSVWRPLEAKRGTILEICGTLPNVEMAQYVHAFLTESGDRLWRRHKRARGIRLDRDRRHFVAGVMTGFYKKLDAERAPREQEGLVWVGDPQLTQHFRRRHPRTTTAHYGTSTGSEAHRQGRAAGEQLVLHRGVHGRNAGETKLLGS